MKKKTIRNVHLHQLSYNKCCYISILIVLLCLCICLICVSFHFKKQKHNLLHNINEFELNVNAFESHINSLRNEYMSLNILNIESKELLKDIEKQKDETMNKLTNIKKEHSRLTNSKLINELSEILTYDNIKLLETWTNKKILFPCYASAGSLAFSGKVFHNVCDIYNNTLTVIKTKENVIIGGYTTQTWEGEVSKEDPNAFVFNLNDKTYFKSLNGKPAISCSYVNLPVFGNDIALTKELYYSTFPSSYSRYDQNGNEGKVYHESKTLLDVISIEVFVLR